MDGSLAAAYRERVEQLSDDVVAFLSEGTRTGLLGYLASDGRPLVAPVWFVVDGGELAFNTGKNVKVARCARDARGPPTRAAPGQRSHDSEIRKRFSTSPAGRRAAG